jgi:hypothetical protein
MPYNAQITRDNPTCLIFLIDRSSSMSKPFGRQPDKQKAAGVAEILNDLLYNLTIQCAKGGGIYDYLHLGIIGYGREVESAFGGPLAGRRLVTVGDLGNNPLEIQDHESIEKDFAGRDVRKVKKRPVWIRPMAGGNTPLAEAFTMAAARVQEFIGSFPRCFPPLILNLTDGKPTTDPRPQAKTLCSMESRDGKVLLFNVHLSDQNDAPIEFPAREDQLTDKFARFLFRLSSILPPKCVEAARATGLHVEPQSRGFVFNADFVSMHKFLEFGTKTQQVNSAFPT